MYAYAFEYRHITIIKRTIPFLKGIYSSYRFLFLEATCVISSISRPRIFETMPFDQFLIFFFCCFVQHYSCLTKKRRTLILFNSVVTLELNKTSWKNRSTAAPLPGERKIGKVISLVVAGCFLDLLGPVRIFFFFFFGW